MDTLIEADNGAEAAARWWAEQVGSPRFDNGDDSDTGGMAMMLSTILASSHPVTTDQTNVFVKTLTEKIHDLLRHTEFVSLGVDYGPDRELAEAADAAGINLSRFPWKTNSWIRHDHVTVSAGYRGATTLIWHAPDWERPDCGSRPWDEGTGEYGPQVCTLPLYHAEDHGEWVPDTARCAECGGTYNDHYGRTGHGRRMDARDFHSWTTAKGGASDA